MYHIAICDDHEEQRELVKHMLAAFSLKSNIELHITMFNSGEELLAHYADQR